MPDGYTSQNRERVQMENAKAWWGANHKGMKSGGFPKGYCGWQIKFHILCITKEIFYCMRISFGLERDTWNGVSFYLLTLVTPRPSGSSYGVESIVGHMGRPSAVYMCKWLPESPTSPYGYRDLTGSKTLKECSVRGHTVVFMRHGYRCGENAVNR